MKFNKIYIPADAFSKHEDFESWYEDGEVFYRFVSKNGWKSEKDKVSVIGRMGGENGLIRPDNRCLNYFIRLERYEYIMHPYVVGRHYYIEGMLWDAYGSVLNPPIDFFTETRTSYTHKDVHIKMKEFKNKGLCYEIHVPDLNKLRIAVISFVAMAIKEEWKGLSEGEDCEGATWLERLKDRVFENKGIPYDEVQRLIELDSPLVTPVRPIGRPMDNV